MFFRHSLDKLIYPVVVLALLAIMAYRPQFRLNNEMPKEFYSEPDTNDGQRMSVATKIAWAYWESAQMDIQWKYPHGSTLPPDPPPEFRIDAKALGPSASDPATRALYWHRLQLVWPLSDAWRQRYEWNIRWLGDPVSSVGQWLRDRADRWFSIH